MAYDRLPESCPPLPGVPQVVYDAINALYLRFASQPQIVAWGIFDGRGAITWIDSVGIDRSLCTRFVAGGFDLFLETPVPNSKYAVLVTAARGDLMLTMMASAERLDYRSFRIVTTSNTSSLTDPSSCFFAVISR